MFKTLFKKHMIYLLRNWKGTSLQVIIPILLIAIISIVSGTIDVYTYKETSYPAYNITTSTDPKDFPEGF